MDLYKINWHFFLSIKQDKSDPWQKVILCTIKKISGVFSNACKKCRFEKSSFSSWEVFITFIFKQSFFEKRIHSLCDAQYVCKVISYSNWLLKICVQNPTITFFFSILLQWKINPFGLTRFFFSLKKQSAMPGAQSFLVVLFLSYLKKETKIPKYLNKIKQKRPLMCKYSFYLPSFCFFGFLKQEINNKTSGENLILCQNSLKYLITSFLLSFLQVGKFVQ